MSKLTCDQSRALEPYVLGRNVHDLGAGDLELSVRLIDLGARFVTAVDKRFMWNEKVPPGLPPRIEVVGSYFVDYAMREKSLDVAFISWPPQHAIEGLVTLACNATTVVYLGSNFGGTICGNKQLFQYFRKREVQIHLPHERNTLIVYGKHIDHRRVLLPEEYAGLNQDGKVLEYGTV